MCHHWHCSTTAPTPSYMVVPLHLHLVLVLSPSCAWHCCQWATLNQCCGSGPFLTGSGSRYFFFTSSSSGSFSYKNRLKSIVKKMFLPSHLHTGSDGLQLCNTALNIRSTWTWTLGRPYMQRCCPWYPQQALLPEHFSLAPLPGFLKTGSSLDIRLTSSCPLASFSPRPL